MSSGLISVCPCTDAGDPQVVSNPPGLSAVSYRVDDFSGFRRALLQPLAGEQAIGAWRPADGDLGLQVLEWWAYLGDVLTFYNERYANESYLGTATQASSVANLVALLGYQPAPGIAAAGSVAAIRKPGYPTEPLVIQAGMQLSSVATAGVPSQTFEVDAEATFIGPSTVPLTLAANTTFEPPVAGTQSVLLQGRVSGVSVGDRLLLLDKAFTGVSDNWSLITVSAITPAPDPATGATNTLVSFPAPAWGPSLPAQIEQWLDLYFPEPGPLAQCTDYRLMRPTGTAALWTQAGTNALALPTVNLSSVVRGISPGEVVLFEQGAAGVGLAVVTATQDMLGRVTNPNNQNSGAGNTSDTGTQPDVIIPYTALTAAFWYYTWVGLAWADYEQGVGSIALRYGFKDVGTIIGVPQATLSSLPATLGAPAASAPAINSTALLQDSTGAGVPVTITGVTVDDGSADVTLAGTGTPAAAITTPLAVPLQLLVDVVGISRGTTVANEVLGSGNAALANQSFTLAKSPLTYLPGPNGPTSTLAVYVNGLQWQEVPSFYGQDPDARVFVVSRSADQTVTTVTFGDGVNGARLSSGNGNVLATYRYGSGSASPPAGRLTTIVQPQPNLASIQNPVAVSGGVDPQAPGDVRADAPGSVDTFGRAISATDYETIASQAPGVARATAHWTFDGTEQRPLVTVYVGDDAAAVTSASTALAAAEDPNRPVSVLPAGAIEIGLSGTLVVAGADLDTVIAAATAAISDPVAGLFSPARMGIGQPLYRSAVAAALMVPGVVAVHELLVTSSEDEFFDPGPGAFYVLSADALEITGVSAGD